MTSSVVSAPATIAVTYNVLLRQLVTRGRLLALSLVGLAVVLVGWAVGRSTQEFFPSVPELERLIRLQDGVEVIVNVGFTVLGPVVALIFAGAALGDTREDGTLVYFWLRPMPRWAVVVGAWLAALSVSLPLILVSLGLTSVVLNAGSELVIATLLAATIATLAYSALFVLLGLMVKNAIVWGLAYIIIWEGVVAAFGGVAAKLAIRGYASSIVTGRTGVEYGVGGVSVGAGIVIPLVVTVAGLYGRTPWANSYDLSTRQMLA